MNNTNGSYRHPQHDAIAQRLREGFSDPAVGLMFGVHRKTVARVRRAEGLPSFTNARTAAESLAEHAVTLINGCTVWKGPVDNNGIPTIRNGGRYLAVSRLVFEQHRGRAPEGMVKADCATPHCLTASHIMDDLGRRDLLLQMRRLEGLYYRWDQCPRCGRDWHTVGRVQPDLKLYCTGCKTDRARDRKRGLKPV
jgi:hypothetical protein